MTDAAGCEVGFCTGKDCRRADRYRTIERELRRHATVVALPCLDVCRGPVVVLRPRSPEPVVLERVSKRTMVLEIVDHLVGGSELPPRLRKRRQRGSARAKARRRIVRAL